jgi:hypothetical protein
VIPYSPPTENGAAWLAMMDRAGELSEVIANTEFVPKGLRGKPPAILAAILYGHEVGIGPMQSLAKIAVIEGRPTLAAETQRGLILAAGHELWIEESTNTRAIVAGRRRGDSQTSRCTWTLDDAKRARIGGKQNWQAYPRQMLLARASAELARAIFADVIGGLAATEELDDDLATIVETPPVESDAAPTTTRRRRRRAAGAEPEPEPVTPAPEPDPPTRAQMNLLMATFREHGYSDDDRDARLAFTSATLGREVATARDLSGLEISRLLDALNAPDAPTFTPPADVQEELRRREGGPSDDFPEGF